MESSRVRTSCSSQALCPIWDSKKAAEGSLETSFKITLLKLEKGEVRDWWVSGPFPNLTFYLNKLLEEILIELSQSPAVSPAAPTAVWHSGFPGDEPRRACVQHFVVRALHFNCSKWSGTCLYLIKQHLLSCSISCCNLAKAEATQHLRLELSTYITAQLVVCIFKKAWISTLMLNVYNLNALLWQTQPATHTRCVFAAIHPHTETSALL